jgi:hypothetical protein
MVNKGNHPKLALFQVSELLSYPHIIPYIYIIIMICLPLLVVWRVSKIVHVSLMIQILVIALAQHDPAVVSEDVYVPLSNHGLFSHKRTYSYPLKGSMNPLRGIEFLIVG